MNKNRIWVIVLATILLGLFVAPVSVQAVDILPGGNPFQLELGIGVSDDPESVVTTLQVLFLISIIALAPSLLILLTGFTRIIIMLAFTRQAMATQQMPPNQVLVGIALFLTIFIMAPVFTEINQNALVPFGAGELSTEEFIAEAMIPLRAFMFRQMETDTGARSLELFMNLTDNVMYEPEDVPMYVLIPAFLVNELAFGFMMGFLIYLPFIVIDMVVASVLMSMGMMMLPPAMISLPFKLMVFILSGGWRIVIESIMVTFRM